MACPEFIFAGELLSWSTGWNLFCVTDAGIGYLLFEIGYLWKTQGRYTATFSVVVICGIWYAGMRMVFGTEYFVFNVSDAQNTCG